MIEIKSLSKRFGDQWALKQTSWSVQSGRTLGLLGPNGAGKSTTMKIMTGLLCSTEGQVLLEGQDILHNPVEAKRKIGYLPETPPLYEELKVVDYLDFICGLKSVPRSEKSKQIDSAIAKLRLNDVAFRPIRILSKGFRQRVGIAQALIGNPRILILDEPSVGLDPHQIFELRNIIKSLKKDHTIVLSSHVLSEIQQVCDDVVILDKGVVKANGAISDILKQNQATSVLEVRLSRFIEGLQGQLELLPEVSTVAFKGSTAEVFLTGKEQQDYNRIVNEIIKAGGGILSLQQKQIQLEDVFIEVTQ